MSERDDHKGKARDEEYQRRELGNRQRAIHGGGSPARTRTYQEALPGPAGERSGGKRAYPPDRPVVQVRVCSISLR
jgi:hypothetical protein